MQLTSTRKRMKLEEVHKMFSHWYTFCMPGELIVCEYHLQCFTPAKKLKYGLEESFQSFSFYEYSSKWCFPDTIPYELSSFNKMLKYWLTSYYTESQFAPKIYKMWILRCSSLILQFSFILYFILHIPFLVFKYNHIITHSLVIFLQSLPWLFTFLPIMLFFNSYFHISI